MAKPRMIQALIFYVNDWAKIHTRECDTDKSKAETNLSLFRYIVQVNSNMNVCRQYWECSVANTTSEPSEEVCGLCRYYYDWILYLRISRHGPQANYPEIEIWLVNCRYPLDSSQLTLSRLYICATEPVTGRGQHQITLGSLGHLTAAKV